MIQYLVLPPSESKLKMAVCLRTVPQGERGGTNEQNKKIKVPAVNTSPCPCSHLKNLFCCRGIRYAVSRESPSSIILRLLLRFPQPGEERRHGLEGHALTLLLGRVFARLPLVESVLGDDVLVVQTVKEHPEEVCKRAKTQRSHLVSLCMKLDPVSLMLHAGFMQTRIRKKLEVGTVWKRQFHRK